MLLLLKIAVLSKNCVPMDKEKREEMIGEGGHYSQGLVKYFFFSNDRIS